MSKIIVPLEPQSSPLAYIPQMLDIDDRFSDSLAKRTTARPCGDRYEMVIVLNDDADPRDLAMHLKLGGVPYWVDLN